MVNPQYHLVIQPRVEGRNGKTTVALTLQANKDAPVNVAMVRTQGQRVAEYVPKIYSPNNHSLTLPPDFQRKK